MEVKCRWCHVCANENSGNIVPDQLEQILPDGHSHFICSYAPSERGFTAAIKLQLSTREEAESWLRDFQWSSGVTLRVGKTYPMTPDTLRRNGYRVDMRCQHKARMMRFAKKPSKKNTDCPAVLYLVLKKQRHVQNRRSRSSDAHIHEGLLLRVTIKHHHNHHLPLGLALRSDPPQQHRDLGSREATETLEEILQSSHSPSSALNALNQEEELQAGRHLPLTSFYQIQDPAENWILDLKCEREEVCVTSAHEYAEGTLPPPTLQEDSRDSGDQDQEEEEDEEGASLPQSHLVCERLKGRLRSMFVDLMDRLDQDETFLAPIEALVSNYENIGTDRGRIAALSTFGLKVDKTRPRKRPHRGAWPPAHRGAWPPAVRGAWPTAVGGRALGIAPAPKRAWREHDYGKS